MNIFRPSIIANVVPVNPNTRPINFNTEYVPIMYLVQNTPIELTKDYIKSKFILNKNPSYLGNFVGVFRYYPYENMLRHYMNSTQIAKKKLPLDFDMNNYSVYNYFKYLGLFYGSTKAFYLLVVKNSYANDFALRYVYGLPIDYSQLEFWVHPQFLHGTYSRFFNPCIEDFKKMDEAGIKVIITDNFEKAFTTPPKGSADLDEDAKIQAEISDNLNAELIKSYVTADLPF